LNFSKPFLSFFENELEKMGSSIDRLRISKGWGIDKAWQAQMANLSCSASEIQFPNHVLYKRAIGRENST
jgi:hypothetical protein